MMAFHPVHSQVRMSTEYGKSEVVGSFVSITSHLNAELIMTS